MGSITETEECIVLDGGEDRPRLRAFNTQYCPRRDWDWLTHEHDRKHIVVRNVTINWRFDMGSVLWLCTARDYLSVTFEASCLWVGGQKGARTLLRCMSNLTRVVTGVPTSATLVPTPIAVPVFSTAVQNSTCMNTHIK